MKATCPKDKTHKKFITVVTVTEDWVVDAQGNFIDVPDNSESEVVHGPNSDNTWTCAECGTQARVDW